MFQSNGQKIALHFLEIPHLIIICHIYNSVIIKEFFNIFRSSSLRQLGLLSRSTNSWNSFIKAGYNPFYQNKLVRLILHDVTKITIKQSRLFKWNERKDLKIYWCFCSQLGVQGQHIVGHPLRRVDLRDGHHPERHDLRGLPPTSHPLLRTQSGLSIWNCTDLENNVLQGFNPCKESLDSNGPSCHFLDEAGIQTQVWGLGSWVLDVHN